MGGTEVKKDTFNRRCSSTAAANCSHPYYLLKKLSRQEILMRQNRQFDVAMVFLLVSLVLPWDFSIVVTGLVINSCL
jgi:hypothetical protein